MLSVTDVIHFTTKNFVLNYEDAITNAKTITNHYTPTEKPYSPAAVL